MPPTALPRQVPGSGRRRIAILLIAKAASGAEQQTLALARALQDYAEIMLLTSDEFGAVIQADPFLRSYCTGLSIETLGPAFPERSAATITGLIARVFAYPRLQWRLRQSLKRFHPDLVHLILVPSFFAFAPWLLLGERPGRRRTATVVTLAGEARYVRYFYGWAKRLAVRWAMARATALIACSADELTNVRVIAPHVASRVRVIDNFTDTDRFHPGPARERLVLFAARLHPEKGALLFVEAMVIVHRAVPDARILLFGQGEDATRVGAYIAQVGLGQVVERGFTADMAPIFARSAIFVSCQTHENLGSSSLLEAMASGAAIVATDVGSTRQIVDDRVGACVAPTATAIAAAVITLLTDDVRRNACGEVARSRVVASYSGGPYLRKLVPIYDAVVSRR